MNQDKIDVTDPNIVVPDLEGIPEDDSAEPEDAEIEHVVPADELDES